MTAKQDDHIIYAYEIDGTGRGKKLTGDAISERIKADALAWVHMDSNHPQTRTWLEKEVDYLDDIILDALLADETRPRVMEHKDGVLVILRGVNLNENEDPDDMVSIRMWIDPHRIITTRRRKLMAVVDIREKLENGNGPKNAADFLTDLSSRLFQRMEPVISALDDRTDLIEEEVLKDPQIKERQEIIDIRTAAITLRRYIAPQKDAMTQLRSTEMPWLDAKHRRKLQENLDRITRYVEDLDAIRERGQIVKDELANVLADRMNKNLYVLSLIAALFLPLGFLTGLMGINVGGMPGVEDSAAFWVVCGVCGIVLILEYIIFRFLRWI